MISSHSIVQTGVNVVATTTASTVQIPFDSSAGRPRYIRVAATAAAYVKVGGSDVVAVAGDLLVQPADSVMLIAAGCNYISVLALTGTCSVSIAPTDDGRWDAASPDALDVLRYYGSNAHIYLPGVGMLNGLQAANYLDSAGTTQGTVDQPVGLVLDAAGGLGVELVTNGDFTNGLTGWAPSNSALLSTVDQKLRIQHNGVNYPLAGFNLLTTAGKTYRLQFSVLRGTSASGVGFRALDGAFTGGGTQLADSGYKTSTGDYQVVFTAVSSASHIYAIVNTTVNAAFDDLDNISVREVTGIHASQPTTASKPILRRDAGGRYYWQFDGSNDSLSLGGPLFQMADDHCVVVGAMCNAATGTAQIVASLSRDSSTGNSAARLQFDPSGTVSAAWTPTSGSAIITAPGNLTGSVKVLAAHKVGNVKRLRVGGVTAGTDSVVQTDTGMNSAVISDYRVGLQLPFNGAVYPIIAIKGTVTDPDLLLLEKFVGQLSGVQI